MPTKSEIYYDTMTTSQLLADYVDSLNNAVVETKYQEFLARDYNPFNVDTNFTNLLLTTTDAPDTLFTQINAELYANGYPQNDTGVIRYDNMTEQQKFQWRTSCDKFIALLMDSDDGQSLLNAIVADSNVNDKWFALFINSVTTPKNVNAFRLSLSQLLQQFVMTNEQAEFFSDALYQCGLTNELEVSSL